MLLGKELVVVKSERETLELQLEETHGECMEHMNWVSRVCCISIVDKVGELQESVAGLQTENSSLQQKVAVSK